MSRNKGQRTGQIPSRCNDSLFFVVVLVSWARWLYGGADLVDTIVITLLIAARTSGQGHVKGMLISNALKH